MGCCQSDTGDYTVLPDDEKKPPHIDKVVSAGDRGFPSGYRPSPITVDMIQGWANQNDPVAMAMMGDAYLYVSRLTVASSVRALRSRFSTQRPSSVWLWLLESQIWQVWAGQERGQSRAVVRACDAVEAPVP
jgi:hypothetical protein